MNGAIELRRKMSVPPVSGFDGGACLQNTYIWFLCYPYLKPIPINYTNIRVLEYSQENHQKVF